MALGEIIVEHNYSIYPPLALELLLENLLNFSV